MPTTNEEQKFGEPIGDFSLPLLGGGRGSRDSILHGKKGAVVVIWSNTCSHCQRYDDFLNDFSRHHPELGLLVLCSRKGETFEGLQKAAGQRRLTFPLAHDADGQVAGQLFTRQTPRAFLVDDKGALLYRGAIDNYKFPEDPEYVAYLEPAIQQFLAGQPVQRTETASFGCAIQSVYYDLPKVL